MGFACIIIVPEDGARSWTIHRWLKCRGDWIDRGDAIALISIAHEPHELLSNMPGVLREIEVHEGGTAGPGRAVFMIEADGDEIPYGRAYAFPVLRVPHSHV